MNKKLLFVFFLISISTIGQNVKSVTRYNWNIDRWTEYWKDNYSQYNSNNQSAYHRREIWNADTNNWKNQTQNFNTFNSDHRVNFSESDFWDSSTNSWKDYLRGYYTYNENGKMLTRTVQSANNGNGWINMLLYNFTYDDNGRLIVDEMETWIQNRLNSVVQYLYNYNADGTVNTITQQRKNLTSNEWEFYERETYSYTATGKTDKMLIESYLDSWIPRENRKFTYDSNDYLIIENVDSWNSDHFAPWMQISFTNDTNGNILEGIQSYIYIPEYNTKLVYEYETLATQSVENPDIFTFSPNPVHDYLDLNFSLNNIQAQIKISDATGKSLIQQSTNNQIKRIDTSSLTTGMYFIEIRTNDAVAVKKIIKN